MEDQEKCIQQFFGEAANIILLKDGNSSVLNGALERKIIDTLCSMCQEAFQMPAFGVSIDKLTREEMKKGIWLRLVYESEKQCFGMGFTELAFQVVPEYRGFNLCRLFQGEYTGRCFYLDLRGGSMSELYEVLITL